MTDAALRFAERPRLSARGNSGDQFDWNRSRLRRRDYVKRRSHGDNADNVRFYFSKYFNDEIIRSDRVVVINNLVRENVHLSLRFTRNYHFNKSYRMNSFIGIAKSL